MKNKKAGAERALLNCEYCGDGEISYDEGFQEGYRTGLEEAAQKCEEFSARFKFEEPCMRCNKEHPLFPSCGVNDGYRMGLRDAFKEAAMVIRALIGEKK